MIDIFGVANGWRGGQKGPFLKIHHTHPTLMKLGIPKEDPKNISITWHTA